jgi:uncharacterized damage-inducible protein DinB
MTRVEQICEQWQDVRNGLIKEVELIPAVQFEFRAAAETRSVLELLQHIIESERVLVGEICRDNTNFARGFPAMIADFAPNVREAKTKEEVIDLLRSSLDESKAKACEFGDANLDQMMTRFDGKQAPRVGMLNFTIAHEMYHRGQLTVYERLLGIEPALTQFFKKAMASRP